MKTHREWNATERERSAVMSAVRAVCRADPRVCATCWHAEMFWMSAGFVYCLPFVARATAWIIFEEEDLAAESSEIEVFCLSRMCFSCDYKV